MDFLCTLTYDSESRVCRFPMDATFEDLLISVNGAWPEFRFSRPNFRYSVSSINNCILDNQVDFMNMIDLCKCFEKKVVYINISLPVNPSSSEPVFDCPTLENINCTPKLPSNLTSQGKSPNFYGKAPLRRKRQTEIPFRVVKPRNIWPNEHELPCMGNLPVYDICPVISRKPLLSDSWGDIFKDGVGSLFNGGAAGFRVELIKHATHQGYNFTYARNGSHYIHVFCDSHIDSCCLWFIKAKLQKNSSIFEVYKGHFTHNCLGRIIKRKTKRFGPSIIGKLLVPDVRSNPNIGGQQVLDILKIGYGIDIPYYKAWRTAEDAKDQLFGTYDDSYQQLRWYCDAVIRTNPGSVIDLEVNHDDNRFSRVFVAFAACIRGFASCRPMLFVDGTFMHGRAKGILLTATAKDGNNGLYPVAFAVVSAENTDNWAWFLKHIRDHCLHPSPIVYISDRHTGLMAAFPIVFAEPVHFFCLFHLITNLKGKFAGGGKKCKAKRDLMVDLFKESAYAPNLRIFEEKISQFKKIGGRKAIEWISQLPVEKWAVAHSPQLSRYGEMTSNAAEAFNAWIKFARGLPITNMIDHIRSEVGRWRFERRTKSKSWDTLMCPVKNAIWWIDTDFSRSWKVSQRSENIFEVFSTQSVSVDLDKRECTCSRWQTSGFPCAHATAAINFHGHSITDYVESYFLTKTYQQCYAADINPIPETEKHACTINEPSGKIRPPYLKRPPGRPKKTRIKSFGETSTKMSG